jgi:hypothetical protein
MTSVGTAISSPNDVVCSASAMPAARNAERWAGSAAPTAENAVVSPPIVPSSPSSVQTLDRRLR